MLVCRVDRGNDLGGLKVKELRHGFDSNACHSLVGVVLFLQFTIQGIEAKQTLFHRKEISTTLCMD